MTDKVLDSLNERLTNITDKAHADIAALTDEASASGYSLLVSGKYGTQALSAEEITKRFANDDAGATDAEGSCLYCGRGVEVAGRRVYEHAPSCLWRAAVEWCVRKGGMYFAWWPKESEGEP